MQTPPRMRDENGVRFGMAAGTEVAALTTAGLAGLAPLPTAVWLVLASALAARRLPGWVVLAVGAIGWAFFTGFVENAYGVLTFSDADLVRLGLFVLCTLTMARAVRPRATAD
ncbi:MAG: hypothetical protein J7518_18625 [Nocardioidaceae bacterium]|nr:hypothetical protein [Nocardioidaceae bacterium]